MKANKQLFLETPRRMICGQIVASDIRPATQEEIDIATLEYHEGNCRHRIVYDEAGWMYDFRYCGICGQAIGLI